ncbi:MAG TPA: DUF2079 domain-containing protein [bacterium]
MNTKIKTNKIAANAWIPPFILAAMIATYTFIIGAWAVNRYMSFNATFWDLGLMTQAIWNTAHGRFLHESVNLGYSVSRLAMAHWELIYLPLAVIYRIVPSIPLLLYIQSFVLACGVIPIYKFSIKKLSSEPAALLISISYLFYPALHGANLFDLHGLTFATTFLLFTFYFLEERYFWLTLILGLLSLSCREDVAFVLFMLGLYSIIFKRNNKIGLIFIIVSVCWFTAFTFRGHLLGSTEILSTANAGSNWDHLGEGGFFTVLISLVKHPLQVIQQLIQFENLKYLAKLFIPVLGMSLLAPRILLIALPTFLLNMLSGWNSMHQIEYHYTATITPFIFLSAVQGMANLNQWLRRSRVFSSIKLTIPFMVAADLLIASICSTMFFSIVRFHENWQVSEANRALAEQLHAIPSPLSVSATARLGPHLSSRQQLYHFPDYSQVADVVILELNRPDVELKNPEGKQRTRRAPAWNEITRAALLDTTFGLRFAVDNVFCLQRGINPKQSFQNYASLVAMPPEAIQVKNDSLENGLVFLGWKAISFGNEQAHFQFYWKNTRQQERENQLKFFLSTDNFLIPIDHQPVFGRVELHEFPVGKIVCDHLFVDRPSNNSVNTYSISAGPSLQERHQLFIFQFPHSH